jgi:hypothetical protein
VGRLKGRRLGFGSNPLAVLAQQLQAEPRCGHEWEPRYPIEGEPHRHRCRRLPGHLTEHICECGGKRRLSSTSKTRLGRPGPF